MKAADNALAEELVQHLSAILRADAKQTASNAWEFRHRCTRGGRPALLSLYVYDGGEFQLLCTGGCDTTAITDRLTGAPSNHLATESDSEGGEAKPRIHVRVPPMYGYDKRLKPTHKAVLWVLCAHMNNQTNAWQLSLSQIAREARRNWNVTRTALLKLQKWGAIDIRRHRRTLRLHYIVRLSWDVPERFDLRKTWGTQRRDKPDAETAVRRHLRDGGKGRVERIARAVKHRQAEVRAALKKLVKARFAERYRVKRDDGQRGPSGSGYRRAHA
jgi:hypothetical protein